MIYMDICIRSFKPDIPLICTYRYGFAVIPSTAAPGSNKTICGNLINGPDFLPPLNLTACFDPKFAYSVAIADGGLSLTVTSALDPHTNITGTRKSDFSSLVLIQSSLFPVGGFRFVVRRGDFVCKVHAQKLRDKW
jgi:hypothetical protein